VIEILKEILTEEQANFLLSLRKPSYNIDQLKKIADLDEASLNNMLKELTHIGALTAFPSRRTGIMVYRLAPFFPGLLEFTLMRGETNEKTKKLAQLWQDFFNKIVDGTQENYDSMMENLKNAGTIDRIIPVGEEIDVKQEMVLPIEQITKIIEEHDTIALMTCYCRHRKDLINDPCKVTSVRKNCFGLGRTAEFLISQNFAEPISKEEALRIMKECEDAGLVHKAFHNGLDPSKELDGICNCCKCCCGTFDIHYAGGFPLMSLTSYLAKVNEEDCTGCSTCVEKCNAEAIKLEDAIAVINKERCIGCGICAHHCPEEAINMERTGPRNVFVPPPRITSN